MLYFVSFDRNSLSRGVRRTLERKFTPPPPPPSAPLTPRESQLRLPKVSLQDFPLGANKVAISPYIPRTEFQPHKINATISKDISLSSRVAVTSISPSLGIHLFPYVSVELTAGCVHGLKCVHKVISREKRCKTFFFYHQEVMVTEDAIYPSGPLPECVCNQQLKDASIL